MYGLPEEIVGRMAEHYGFAIRKSFKELDEGHNFLVQSQMLSHREQYVFWRRMDDFYDHIDAVIAVESPMMSTVHYCSEQGKFYTVDASDEETIVCELTRILDSLFGNICAHEGV